MARAQANAIPWPVCSGSISRMAVHLPLLQTDRLIIRPFVPEDLDEIHQILDVDLEHTAAHEAAHALEDRRSWLDWSIQNERELRLLYQPPFGDRAVTLADGNLIGSVGYSAELKPFAQVPYFAARGETHSHYTAEVGLFWAIGSRWQRQGYATEAGGALVRFAFQSLRLKRIIATTEYDNVASIGVMRRLGMQIERNPLPDPPWFQIVGVLERDAWSS
jgi:ribosomal-protein-alanine N-acetyltransferase